MNRRKLLRTLGSFPLVLLAVSCERKIFSRATIITGKVIDQDGNPLEGVPFDFYGERKTGFSGVPTFHISAVSDSTGQYQLSQNIPKKTDSAWVLLNKRMNKHCCTFEDFFFCSFYGGVAECNRRL